MMNQTPLCFFENQLLSKFPPFATISRQWQYAIERRTFYSLSVKSTEYPYILGLIVGHRRGVLAGLTYKIMLPTSGDACAKFENEVDERLNNVFFTEAVHGLFRLLESWKEGSGKRIQDGSRTPAPPILLDFFPSNLVFETNSSSSRIAAWRASRGDTKRSREQSKQQEKNIAPTTLAPTPRNQIYTFQRSAADRNPSPSPIALLQHSILKLETTLTPNRTKKAISPNHHKKTFKSTPETRWYKPHQPPNLAIHKLK